MASTVRLQPIPSEISTFAPPLSPFSTLEHKSRDDGDRERRRRGSVASTGSRRELPRKDSCLLGSDKTNKEYSDASRRRPASICSALGGGSVDSIISSLRAGAEKRMTSGMGLREQEQHMVKIGRENWALKIDVTMLKKKRDELGTINEKLTRQVETLSRENRELKRVLKRTKEDLEKRERELDEACRMYEKLGATSVVLEELSKKQQAQQHHERLPPEEYILEARNYGCPRSPIVKVEGSRPSSRLAYSKSPQSASQAPEFWGPSVRASGQVSPSPSEASTNSTRTGISRSGFQSPLPSKSQALGLPFLSSPSVSTCCSLRRIPIPRHVESDDEEDDSSSGEDIPTPNPNEYSDDESDNDSDLDSEYSGKGGLKEPNSPPQLATPKANMIRVQMAKITPPSSNASAYTKRGSFRRRILKFNREEEPDTSDYSSEEEDMFDSDAGGSTTSLPHTLTPMTASPEPNKGYLVPEDQDKEWKPRATALAAVAKRVSYAESVGGDLEPIDERSAVTNNVPFTYRHSMFDDYLNLQLPEQVDSVASSMVNVNTSLDRCQNQKSRIPAPSTTSAVAQKRRKHLDSLSRLVVAREVLSRKMLQV